MFQLSVLTHFLNIISLHYKNKKLAAFPYGTKHFHNYMKQFLCNAHLNFDNSTHKIFHKNQSMLKK